MDHIDEISLAAKSIIGLTSPPPVPLPPGSFQGASQPLLSAAAKYQQRRASLMPPPQLERTGTLALPPKRLEVSDMVDDHPHQTKARSLVLTCNNWTDVHYEMFMNFTLSCKYWIVAKEGKTKTPHLQCMVMFNNPRAFNSCRKCLTGFHLEICANPFAAMEYCKKEGDYKEGGCPPISQAAKGLEGAKGGKIEQTRWRSALDSAKRGDFDAIPAQIQIMHGKGLDRVYQKALLECKLDYVEQKTIWIYGPSGSGKTRLLRKMYPDAYLKNSNKWWDGYNNRHRAVIIEDFEKDSAPHLAHFFKLWFDCYPFMAEVKSGTMKIRPEQIFVTSNYHPQELWTDKQIIDPILRRCTIFYFGPGEPPMQTDFHVWPVFEDIQLITSYADQVRATAKHDYLNPAPFPLLEMESLKSAIDLTLDEDEDDAEEEIIDLS